VENPSLSLFKASVYILLIFTCRPAAAEDWRPINPEDLASKTAVVEKDADAEALFWEVRLDDAQTEKTVLRHYLRMKIFTARGAESQTRIDLPYFNGVRIADIQARTTRADGSVVELKKDAVFDRTILKAGKAKLKSKSFVVPGAEPGAIIEYQWREDRDSLAQYVRLEFQREIPVRTVKYYVKPFVNRFFTYPMVFNSFHMPNVPLEKEKSGFFSFTLNNVPAFKEEPYMPPESEVRPWILLYYAPPLNLGPAQYWSIFGRQSYEVDKTSLKVNDDIKKASTAAIAGATNPEEKLAKLFEFVRTKISNPYDDASGTRADELSKIKENETPADTLKRGLGTPFDIDMLFGTLAVAAGFDVRIARVSDRSDIFFEPSMANSYFLGSYDIAVKVGNDWRFFNPGGRYVPLGMLGWNEEGVRALVPDPREPQWVTTPYSPAAKTLQRRTAKFRLMEDGTIEGDVAVEYTGHFAMDQKERHDALSAPEQEEEIIDAIKSRLSTAQVSAIMVDGAKDPVKPVTIRYHIKVPQYAQRTGRRLFFQPGFFAQGESATFTSSTRKYSLYFPFSWSEEDDITIELPQGLELENAEAPAAIRSGDIALLDIKMATSADGRELHYDRKFSFGGTQRLLLLATQYSTLKQLFDTFYVRNTHMLTLREGSSAPAR
jgi:Domain of Unknown Function with PDB structure (DUF3857)